MTSHRSQLPIRKLSEYIASHMGLHFPEDKFPQLEKKIRRALPGLDCNDYGESVNRLLTVTPGKEQVQELARHLSVSETYFFRNRELFNNLERQIFPELIRSRRGAKKYLRIWSAGCSSGEEPYSIAILLSKLIPNIDDWDITILATDINPDSLNKASVAKYDKWSFRGTPDWVKENYFSIQPDGKLELHPDVKKLVTFSYLNLMEFNYPSSRNNTYGMDLIFCQNVLMYFSEDNIKKVTSHFYKSLTDGGLLITSPCESSNIYFPLYVRISTSGLIMYTKDEFGSRQAKEQQVCTASPPPRPPVITSPNLPTEAAARPHPASSDRPAPPSHVNGSAREEMSGSEKTPYDDVQGLYERGDYEAVLKILLPLVSKDSDIYETIHLLVKTYSNLGDLEEALRWCDYLVEADKMDPRHHYLRSSVLQEKGLVEDAIQSLKRSIYLDPNFVIAHFSLGNIIMQHGQAKRSRRHFKNALSVLSSYRPEDILPESDGLTARSLTEIISSIPLTGDDK